MSGAQPCSSVAFFLSMSAAAMDGGTRWFPLTRPDLRPLLGALLALAACAAEVHAFGFDDVVSRAQKLAQAPFEEPHPVPEWLINLSYDQWRDIRFRPERSLWRDRK